MRSFTPPGMVSQSVTSASGSRTPSGVYGGASKRYHDECSEVVGVYSSHHA
jgi:hypothetical protein